MEYPMRVYGLNLFERVLTGLLAWTSWLLILYAAAVVIWPDVFFSHLVWGTVLIVCTFFTAVLNGMAGSGIRQNRTALSSSAFMTLLLSIGWIINGILSTKWGSIVAGGVIFILFLMARMLKRRAIKTRFNPRFFSLRQFETMVQVADAMIDGDGKEVLHPIEVAIRSDHMMAKIDSHVTGNIKMVMFLVEWFLPLFIFRPFPFTTLGSHARRRAIEKVIGSRGIFRDVARSLKMLTSGSYFGDPKGMAQVGYVPFDDRHRAQGKDQSPIGYPDPFPGPFQEQSNNRENG